MRNFTDGELATLAEKVRKNLGAGLGGPLDVYHLVLKLRDAKEKDRRVTFQEVSAGFMKGAKARAMPAQRLVQYTQDLWDKLRGGSPLAAFIFLEEIAHVFLGHNAKVLDHADGYAMRSKARPEVAEMETEAEKLVWFLQAPISECYSVQSAGELVTKFRMTDEAAERYFEHIKQTRQNIESPKRELPAKVVDFLEHARKKYGSKAHNYDSPKAPSPPHENLVSSASKTSQYSGFSHVPCKNCGHLSVRFEAGCLHCVDCGDDDGCS